MEGVAKMHAVGRDDSELEKDEAQEVEEVVELVLRRKTTDLLFDVPE